MFERKLGACKDKIEIRYYNDYFYRRYKPLVTYGT